MSMIGIPERTEAAEYYYKYIDRVTSEDVLSFLEGQLDETTAFLRCISEEKSLYRYAPDKWSIRESWSHVNDAERVFTSRALWFARGLDSPLPSFDQEIAVRGACADTISWARHIDEFRLIRMATVSLFQNLPLEAWKRTGMASGYPFTVRSLAYIVAGHTAHHIAILRERYLAAA
jgi:hypothetical protein